MIKSCKLWPSLDDACGAFDSELLSTVRILSCFFFSLTGTSALLRASTCATRLLNSAFFFFALPRSNAMYKYKSRLLSRIWLYGNQSYFVRVLKSSFILGVYSQFVGLLEVDAEAF